MRQYKYRAVVSPDGAPFSTRAWTYPSGTDAVMIRCCNPAAPAGRRYFPAAIYRPATGSGEAGVVVTIEVADDEASALLGPGQRVTRWNGHEIGHGVICRRVFFTTAP